MKTALLGSLLLALLSPLAGEETSPFAAALRGAEAALASGELDRARALIDRALERDAKAPQAWALRARWAEAAKDRDELVWSLHQELRLRAAQKAPREALQALRERLFAVDPLARELDGLKEKFLKRLAALAEQYEKDRRPHSAIRVHKEVLALDPESAATAAAIERLASAPDPSLAEDAKSKDLLEGISEEWIRDHDEQHSSWKERASLERASYVTHTDAGYACLVRAAEAMEQMNAFYRRFFGYGLDGGGVARIELRIFKDKDEYLKLGEGPPVEWSGGQFTGGAVETYVGDAGFEGMVGTLFHEAAHQFVSLSTNASGWLNEGLASFFEGCRILSNGTVLMNLPADHRLFPLVERMERGWMSSASDGIDQANANVEPSKAPTFRIVLEDQYEWGPAWYAPTWGVVYFLHNYQDPFDGRYVYRAAFREFIDSSGGRMGAGAVENFEQVVLASPAPPYKDKGKAAARPPAIPAPKLPGTVEELDPVWKEWLAGLRDRQLGKVQARQPWLRWARFARDNGDLAVAAEHFENGLLAAPNDVDLLVDFGKLLADQKNTDRAARLAMAALRVLDGAGPDDAAARQRAQDIEALLETWDPRRAALERVHAELWAAAKALVERYEEGGLPLMVMDVSAHLATELGAGGLMEAYERALRKVGRSPRPWRLAYNEKDLDGWNVAGPSAFAPDGTLLRASSGEYQSGVFDYEILTLDEITSGDYSLEVEVNAEAGEVSFCGLVFGRKDATSFHALILFPGRPRAAEASTKLAESGFVDLASFYGGVPKTWRHNPVDVARDGQTSVRWHELRIDVSGGLADAWCDGALLATQDFGGAGPLRGSFGLITGRGKARFRDVRFLSRPPRDPSAAIERLLRKERQKEQGGGGAVDGSWLGQVPPFPKVGRWAQGSRKSWDEASGAPQIFVLWSIHQNGIIPIDGWLRDLARDGAGYGLEILSVCSPNDEAEIDAYLKEHPFPGAVAVDHREGAGVGDTNKTYFTPRFNLPRLILLDVDGSVRWEGDPGFSATEPWRSGIESYLDMPLRDLVDSRQLREVRAWIGRWREIGRPALEQGDLAAAAPVLSASKALDRAFGEVEDARAKLEALEKALGDLKATAAAFEAQGRAPALAVLLEWARLVSFPLDRAATTSIKSATEGPAAKGWERALKQLEAARAKFQKDPSALEALLQKLAAHPGAFPAELAEALRAAAGDPDALERVAAEAPARPRQWLARAHFGW